MQKSSSVHDDSQLCVRSIGRDSFKTEMCRCVNVMDCYLKASSTAASCVKILVEKETSNFESISIEVVREYPSDQLQSKCADTSHLASLNCLLA